MKISTLSSVCLQPQIQIVRRKMNIIGITGVHQNIAFKTREFPGLSKRQYRINQGFD